MFTGGTEFDPWPYGYMLPKTNTDLNRGLLLEENCLPIISPRVLAWSGREEENINLQFLASIFGFLETHPFIRLRRELISKSSL